jgi:tripeptidyl-peptidase-1
MKVMIAVKQPEDGKKELERRFWEVSDPSSPKWQEFLERDEIAALVASSLEDMHKVTSWIMDEAPGALVNVTADNVEVLASVREIEHLFETEINIFTHDNGHTILRAMGPFSIPKDVREAIDFVEGVVDFPMHRASSKKRPTARPQGQTAVVAPQTLFEMYKIPADKVPSSVSQAPAEFQDDTSYNKEDLKTFFEQTDLPAQTVKDIVGPYDGSMPDTEATLDVQYIMGVGQKQTDWYWTAQNWMYTFSQKFFNNPKVPDAVSMSWGWSEAQQCSAGIAQAECQTLGIDNQQYVTRVNTEFMKIGLRGVSLLVASGDSGANGRSDEMCTDKVLHPTFPAASPYVTAVGATQLSDPQFNLQNPPKACKSLPGSACASGGTEVSVSVDVAGFTSGGGFSDVSPMPAYQQKAVDSYLSSSVKLPPASMYNRTGRAYPDVAAMGNNFLIYMQQMGGWSTVGGTSASSPTVAGVSAYLNDLSYKVKGKPLGFLNPLFYQMQAEAPEAFTDVTSGDNRCTESGCSPTCKGFEAYKGWDPVSGLGTPVADKMLAWLEKKLKASVVKDVVV